MIEAPSKWEEKRALKKVGFNTRLWESHPICIVVGESEPIDHTDYCNRNVGIESFTDYKKRFVTPAVANVATFVFDTVYDLSSDIDEEFLEELKSYYISGNKEVGVEFVYDYFGSLIIQRKFDRCDEILEKVSNEDFSTWILLPFLTLSKFYKKELPNRSVLFAKAVVKFLNTMDPEQVKATVNRLV